MESKKVRSSNMELLRIMAMAMIVVAHVIHNGARYQLIDSNSMIRMGNNFFCNPEFYDRLFLVTGLLPFGNIGNAIFILISGYFMVERGKNIRWGEISKNLLLQLGFAVCVRIIVPFVYYRIYTPNKDVIINYGGINEFNSVYWFPGYYLLVIVLAGLLLNIYFSILSQSAYKNILWVMFGIFSLTWSGGILDGLAKGLRTLVCGVFLYALGGYIKRFNPFGRVKAWVLCVIILVSFVVIYLSYYGIAQNGIHSFLANAALLKAKGRNVGHFVQPMFYMGNFSLLVIVIGTVFLELFSRIRIANNKIINFIASGSLMVYFLHGNGFWIAVLRELDWVKALWYNPKLYCFKVFQYSVITYVVGIIGYILYLGLHYLLVRYKYLLLKEECKDTIADNLTKN